MEVEFKEREQLIGHVTSASGSLILVDGAIQTALRLPASEVVELDLNKDNHKIPVYAVQQNGKRFLLVSIDDAVPIQYNTKDRIKVSDPVDIPEEVKETFIDEEAIPDEA